MKIAVILKISLFILTLLFLPASRTHIPEAVGVWSDHIPAFYRGPDDPTVEGGQGFGRRVFPVSGRRNFSGKKLVIFYLQPDRMVAKQCFKLIVCFLVQTKIIHEQENI